MLVKAAMVLLARITVVIYHPEAVPEREMARAESLAGGLMRLAGVEIQWRRATPADLYPRAAEVPLHLLDQRPPFADPDACGYAVLMQESSYAGVSYRAARDAAATLEVEPSTVLAAAIVHELGHILLASREHTAAGPMAAHLGRRDIEAARRGEFRFSHDQARRMRDEVARRLGIATMPR